MESKSRCCCLLSAAYLLPRTAHLLLDRGKRIIGVLAGSPKGRGWQEACEGAFFALDRVAQKAVPTKKDAQGRRGIYPSVAYGVSLGTGQSVSLPTHACCQLPYALP